MKKCKIILDCYLENPKTLLDKTIPFCLETVEDKILPEFGFDCPELVSNLVEIKVEKNSYFIDRKMLIQALQVSGGN